ncbi:MAG: hypothetical protein R3E63_07460 [Pseudomonadales bacterium]
MFALEDTNHGFTVTVSHDGERHRHRRANQTHPLYQLPWRGGAYQATSAPAFTPACATLNFHMPPSSNCTHLLDLTIMAIRHAPASNPVRQWDIHITDQTDQRDAICTVQRDGVQIFQWQARDLQLTQPQEFAGNPVLFSASANGRPSTLLT